MVKKNLSEQTAVLFWKSVIPFMIKDIDDLMEAVERCRNMDTDFSSGYRLIRLNAKYARCRRGIFLLENSNINFQPDVFSEQPHLSELQAQMQESCTLADNVFSGPSSSLIDPAPLFHKGAELWERVDDLQKAFDDFVLDCVESRVEDDEDFLSELKNQGLDLIFHFSELYSVAHEPLSIFKDIAAFTAWKSHFAGVENNFRSCFDCFSILNYQWDKFRLYEYFADFWWLNTSRVKNYSEIQENTVSPEALISSLGNLYKTDREPADLCPDFEMIAAFANEDDIDHEIKTAIEQHTLLCNGCHEEVQDIRNANVEAEQGFDNLLYGYSNLWDDILESMIRKHPERYVKTHQDTGLFFDLEGFPPYMRALEPFRETMPMMHSSDASFSDTIIGFVRWLKHGKEYCRARVDVTILFEDFEDGILTITGSLQENFTDLIPRMATWHCKWETDDKGGGIDPETFDYDPGAGQFTAQFSMKKKLEGRFVIWFDVRLETS